MRRLTIQFFALLLAAGALRLVTGADAFVPYTVRDALLVAILAAAIFAWQSSGWRASSAASHIAHLSGTGAMIWLTGAVCLLAGGIGTGFDIGGLPHLAANLIWGLGLVLVFAGAWWPGAAVDYALPAYRWDKDARGQFVRTPRGDAGPDPAAGARGASWLWPTAVILLALLVRFWNVAELPAGCMAGECIDALRVVDGQSLTSSSPGTFNLMERLAGLLYGITGDGLVSLRLAAAALGSLTVIAFGGVARRLTPAVFVPAAMLLLALNPWHIAASRIADGWITSTFWVTLALWLTLEALAHADLRWWTAAGVAFGVVLADAPALRLVVLSWAGVALVLGLWAGGRRRTWRRRVAAPLAGLATMLGAAAPALVYALRSDVLFPALNTGAPWVEQAATLAGSLLRGDATLDGAIAGSGLLTVLIAALCVLGFGALVRHVRQPATILLLAGAFLLSMPAFGRDLTVSPPRSTLLPVLPLFLAAGAIAIDRLLTALVQAWGRIVRPARLVSAASLVLLVILGVSLVQFAADLSALQGGAQGSVENDMARYIARQLAASDTQQTYVVPAAVLNHASMRLIAADAVSSGRVQLLDLATTMPYTAAPAGDVIYLVPIQQSQVLDELRQLYPTAQTVEEGAGGAPAFDGRRARFSVLTVPRDTILASHALQMRLYRGSEPSEDAVPDFESSVPLSTFAWQTMPPLPPPFTARLSASLSVPEAGDYAFSSDIDAGATLTMKLGDVLVLDTQLGLQEQRLALAQGIYPLQLEYRSGGQPSDFQLQWQRPGGSFEPLPVTAMHIPVAADKGLIGDYRAGSDPAGMEITRRNDRIIGFDFGLDQPYNVFWQGQLGVTRAGEYLLATLSDGPNQVTVDGALVVDGRPDDIDATDDSYNEGLVYLQKGWHPIDVRYTPESDAPEFRLLWQAPGSSPGELTSFYLLPITGAVSAADRMTPPAPPLLDPALGNDDFALTRPVTTSQPGVRLPPAALESLPLELAWSAGAGCGAAAGQFNAPHGLAFDPSAGRIYVADTGNRRIQVLGLDGAFQTPIAAADFQEPVDVGTAPDGALLVLDAVAGPIYRISQDGALSAVPIQTSFYRPRGFHVAADGSIAVADTGGGRVVVLGADGAVQSQFGGVDTLLARGQPVDALSASNGVWGMSAEDGRLWNLSIDGSLTALQPTNTIDGPQLAALPNGGLVATDPLRRTFTTFTANGQPMQQFAFTDQLLMPTGIAALATGDQLLFAVSDVRACSVSLWRMAQSQLRQ